MSLKHATDCNIAPPPPKRRYISSPDSVATVDTQATLPEWAAGTRVENCPHLNQKWTAVTEWMMTVHHTRGLRHETLWKSLHAFNAYCGTVTPMPALNMYKIYATACMWIGAKCEEVDHVSGRSLLRFMENKRHNIGSLKIAELCVLKAMKWHVPSTTPICRVEEAAAEVARDIVYNTIENPDERADAYAKTKAEISNGALDMFMYACVYDHRLFSIAASTPAVLATAAVTAFCNERKYTSLADTRETELADMLCTFYPAWKKAIHTASVAV